MKKKGMTNNFLKSSYYQQPISTKDKLTELIVSTWMLLGNSSRFSKTKSTHYCAICEVNFFLSLYTI